MAGSQPGFDSSAFRRGIRFVYEMAAPPADSDQVTFYFPSQLVYTSTADAEGVPFDVNETIRRVKREPVRVPCAVEYFDVQGQEVVFGTVTAARIALTLLDEDYAQITGFEYVLLGGQKYNYRRTEAPSGLFDVGLFVVHATAEDLV